MGSFIFTWEHPADEVYVTGTFDDWSKSERLEKTNTIFAKRVFLTNVSEKIYYKFVVDGNWITDHTAPQENDESGNLNNVLTADRITIQKFDTIGTMSGVTPESSSVPLAASVPLEKGKRSEPNTLPGTFPETPAAEGGLSEYLMNPQSGTEICIAPIIPENNDLLDSYSDNVPVGRDEKEQTFSVSPLPAFPGAVNPVSISPGQKLPDYRTLTSNTLTSAVDLGKDEKEQTFSVSPLPAFPGAVNPVSIPPGQKLPDYRTLTSNTLTSAVDLGKDEKEQTFSVSPLPAFPGAVNPVSIPPGQKLPDYRTLTSNTLTSTVDLGRDEKEQTFSVSPLPAFPGAVNPVSIPPGQKLPDYRTLTSNTLTSAVDLGKESATENDYTQDSSQAPPSENAPTEREDDYTVSNSRTGDSNKNIPGSTSAIESRIKENFPANYTIQSVGPHSSTAEMVSGVPKNESLILPTGNASSINFTSSYDPESQTNKEGSGIHDVSKLDSSVTPGQLVAQTKTTSEIHPSNFVSESSDETTKAVNNSLKPEQNLNAVVNEENKSEAKVDSPIGKSGSVTIPTDSMHQNLSQAVMPHTVTTVESSNIDRETKTSDSHVADETNDTAGNDKANKKKKRSSFFGKIKAKLTFKDKD